MRVSSNMMTTNYMQQLQRSYQNQANLMEQSDGNAIHRPSDDPVAYVRTMTYKNSLCENEQYMQNLDDAVSWMNTTDSAMTNMTEILKIIATKTEAAANGTNKTEDTEATATEVDALIEQLVTIGNTQLGNRYIFSGQSDDVEPFTIQKTEVNRAAIKTLDTKQEQVFGTAQMLTMADDAGNQYYLDTTSGDLFTKEYMDSGYKDVVTQSSNLSGDALKAKVVAGKVGNLNVSSLSVTTKTGMTTATETYDGLFVNKMDTSKTSLFQVNGTVDGALATADSYSLSVNISGTPTNLSFTTTKQKIVSYSGDNNKISMAIQNGSATPSRDSVNTTGADVFGTDMFGSTGTELLNNLYAISEHMHAGDTSWLSSDGLTLANDAHDQVLNAQTEIAGRNSSYTLTKAMMETKDTVITTDITNASATEVDKLIVALKTAQTLYNMSLSVGSKILPMSLADYLR